MMMKGDETPYEFFRGPLPGLYKPLNRFATFSLEYADQYDQLTSGSASAESPARLETKRSGNESCGKLSVRGSRPNHSQESGSHNQWIEFDTQVRDVGKGCIW